jgi:ESCRT-II complex subunit VPS25
VRETRERQGSLWCGLILGYCAATRTSVLRTDERDPGPLFGNAAIGRALLPEARAAFLGELVAAGRAEWLDKGRTACLVLWRSVEEWARLILELVRTYGLGQAVMSVEELSSGDDVAGTELAGADVRVLRRALKLLEGQGKCRLFSGATPEEEGVKFL